MVVTLFDDFRITDIEILTISLGIRSNSLIEGLSFGFLVHLFYKQVKLTCKPLGWDSMSQGILKANLYPSICQHQLFIECFQTRIGENQTLGKGFDR